MKIRYENSLINEKELKRITKKLFVYIDEIKRKILEEKYNFYESFLLLPEDKENLEKINNLAKKYKNISVFILIGIGGSNLGSLSIYSLLKHKIDKEILFVETFDSLNLKNIINKIEKEYKESREVAIILISKSGTTIETLANFNVVSKKLKKIDKNYKEKIIVITNADSILDNYSKKFDFEVLYIPKLVAGRFSIFSSAGLFPLKLMGFNLEKLLDGAKKMAKICLEKNFQKNYALISAAIIYYHYLKNKNIYNIFLFLPQLENFGNWYKQLIAESLGKEGKGISPIISIGTRDLHSMYQLFANGPKDKLTNFIVIENLVVDYKLSDIYFNEIRKSKSKSINELMKITYTAVKESYKKLKLPFYEIILKDISEKEIGALMQMKMVEIIYLGKLLNVNPFDQPAVEYYKREIINLI